MVLSGYGLISKNLQSTLFLPWFPLSHLNLWESAVFLIVVKLKLQRLQALNNSPAFFVLFCFFLTWNSSKIAFLMEIQFSHQGQWPV